MLKRHVGSFFYPPDNEDFICWNRMILFWNVTIDFRDYHSRKFPDIIKEER